MINQKQERNSHPLYSNKKQKDHMYLFLFQAVKNTITRSQTEKALWVFCTVIPAVDMSKGSRPLVQCPPPTAGQRVMAGRAARRARAELPKLNFLKGAAIGPEKRVLRRRSRDMEIEKSSLFLLLEGKTLW